MTEIHPLDGRKVMKYGILASLLAALCCFTPLLVVAFTAAGLSGLIGGIDYIAFPALFAGLGLITQALYIQADRPGRSPKAVIALLVIGFSVALLALQFHFLFIILAVAVVLLLGYALYLRRGANPPELET